MSKVIGPVIIDDFFTKQEIAQIYKTVNEQMYKGLIESGDKWQEFNKNPSNGFVALMHLTELVPQNIKDKFRDKVTELIGEQAAPVGVLWARYSLDSGVDPTLMPHCDRSEKHMGYYCNVELDSNIDWDFYMVEEKIPMKRNRAVFFTGTHMPHWRPDYFFQPDDFYDIILFQTTAMSNYDQNKPTLTEDFRDEMDELCNKVSNKYKDKLTIGLNRKMNVPRY